MELWKLLAHNHWYTLNFFGYELRLCSRCSGYVLGLSTIILSTRYLGLNTGYWSQSVILIIIATLSIPMILDWLSQSWGLRESTNHIRLVTGMLMGLSIGIFSQLNISVDIKRVIFLWLVFIILFAGSPRANLSY
jgi:uncharacterized membrane protein